MREQRKEELLLGQGADRTVVQQSVSEGSEQRSGMPTAEPMSTASERPAAAASATVGGTAMPGGKSLNFAAANSTATAYLPESIDR